MRQVNSYHEIDYQLIRSQRRKTLGLQVKSGQVIIRAPYFVTRAFIDAFVQEKSAWLRTKIFAQQQRQVNHFDFSHGSELLWLGNKVILLIYFGDKSQVYGQISQDCKEQSSLTVVIPKNDSVKLVTASAMAQRVKKQLESYFAEQAANYLLTRLDELSEQTLLIPKQVKIRQYRARWGSCNSRKEVSFNYLLMMVPPWVFDYVIVHELCHLKHLNHSKDFWQLVVRFYPLYQQAKNWLNENQADLLWQLP